MGLGIEVSTERPRTRSRIFIEALPQQQALVGKLKHYAQALNNTTNVVTTWMTLTGKGNRTATRLRELWTPDTPKAKAAPPVVRLSVQARRNAIDDIDDIDDVDFDSTPEEPQDKEWDAAQKWYFILATEAEKQSCQNSKGAPAKELMLAAYRAQKIEGAYA